jgi:hypothetical protein
MTYKGITINGMRGCGFNFVLNNVVWNFNRLASAKQFIDGMTV